LVEEQFLISTMEPSRRQRLVVAVFALLLLLAFLATLPCRTTPLARVDSFIPMVDAVVLLGDTLTTILLFSQAAVLRSRSLIALATGYLFTGLIIVPHALTFHGAFAESGLLGGDVNTPTWFYLFWHTGLPLAVIAYAGLKKSDAAQPMARDVVSRTIAICIASTFLLAAALTVLATRGAALLPAMTVDAVHWIWARALAAAIFFVVLLLGAMICVMTRRVTLMDLWLLLALWAWLIEVSLMLSTSDRFSGGWYVGRVAGLLSGLLVLIMLIAETNWLYARLALTVMTRHREKESRQLTMNAVAASIAHEVRQPLTAIVTSANAGSAVLRQSVPALDELREILTAISEQGLRAGQVVESVRAMLVHRPTNRLPLDINELLRDTAALIANEIRAGQISLQLELDDAVSPVHADRLQVQHVFLNLLTNAIEAMSGVTDRARLLLVRTAATERNGVLVTVQDSGTGIDEEIAGRIFEAFFTTKTQGTGMGLSLSRSIVEAHSGKLWVSRSDPSGATFHVQLPG
jgi:signal transduction histidine kinase